MKRFYAIAAVGLQSMCLMAMNTQSSHANNITFAVIAPHEYELPVNYDDFSVFVQYNQINSSSKFYNNNGNLVDNPGGRQNMYVGLSKYVYFTTFDALPGVGWAFEAIVPEVRIDLKNANNPSGVGDPIFGFATWIKPTPNSTLGVQSFLQPPIGSREVTNNYWNNLSSVLFDIQFEKISFVGDVGGVFAFSEEKRLGSFRPGDSFHTNLRWGYKFDDKSIPFEPYVAFDFQSDGTDRFAGSRVANSAGRDLSLGGGVVWKINDQYSIAAHYSRSVDGRNVVPTNAVYFRLAIAPLFKTSKMTAPIVAKY